MLQSLLHSNGDFRPLTVTRRAHFAFCNEGFVDKPLLFFPSLSLLHCPFQPGSFGGFPFPHSEDVFFFLLPQPPQKPPHCLFPNPTSTTYVLERFYLSFFFVASVMGALCMRHSWFCLFSFVFKGPTVFFPPPLKLTLSPFFAKSRFVKMTKLLL